MRCRFCGFLKVGSAFLVGALVSFWFASGRPWLVGGEFLRFLLREVFAILVACLTVVGFLALVFLAALLKLRRKP